jgi:adenylate cyclase
LGVFKSRSFRVDILTAFGSLLLVTFLAVIIYNYQSTSRIVLMLCDDLMEKTTQTVINKTVGFLTAPAGLTELNGRLFGSGVLPIDNQAKLERLALECLSSQPQIAMFLIGDRNGNFLLGKPEADGSLATKFINRQVKPPLTTWKYWNKDYQVIRTETNTTDLYDPRERPWYQGAEGIKGIYWTDLYIFYTGKKPGITVSYPILDSQGKVAGVIGCDIELVKLSHFLQSLKIGKNGLVFIINEKQELVAFTDPAQIMVDPGETGLLRPFRVDSLDNRSVVAAYREYVKTGREEFALEVSGERYRASFNTFPPSFGKPWKVGVVVPENDFIGVVNELTRRVLVICLVFLTLSVLMAILLARRISRPILRLAKETDNIRNFQLDESLDLKSHIAEIEILSEAINRMKVSLRSFMRFAPQQLVEEVVLGGKELMLGGDRREVTLLFSDLRGFTQFAERTRPEEVVQILNVHFDAMVRIISDHGGYVVDFLGDSLFAVFGAPKSDPNHAFQAIKCALTMQLTRQRLNEELDTPHLTGLEMGIGINSGSCVVGNMGSQLRIKYGVVGHAVNLAARIETFTVGGQILISEAARQLGEDQISVIGPLQAYGKGVEGAMQLWEVRSLRHEPDLVLPPTVPGLSPLSQPVQVHFRLITGKQIAPELYMARITRLSGVGAALATDLGLDDFAAMQIQLAGEAGETIHLDGKVVNVVEAGQEYIVRFSPLDEAGARAVAGILKASAGAVKET